MTHANKPILSLARLGILMLAASFLAAPSANAQDYDLVILNGRVMDPETKLDGIRNVGINGGRIDVITDADISGDKVIDASGHVVAPGFIDFHWHGQDPFGIKLALRGGVTSPLELEVGAHPVDLYYASKDGKSQANYGVSVSHLSARLGWLDKIKNSVAGLPIYSDSVNKAAADGSRWSTERTQAGTADRLGIVAAVEKGLRQGALGIGFPIGYATRVSSDEVVEVAGLAKRYNSFILTHVRYLSQVPPSGYLGTQEFLAAAKVNDVPLIVQHVPSNCLGLTEACLKLIEEARSSGLKVAAEFYPYEKGSSFVGADYLAEGFQERMGMEFSDILIVETNETLTEETYKKYRSEEPGAAMIMHHIKNEDMMRALAAPRSFVGSDAFPYIDERGMPLGWDAPYDQARGHPRGAGTSAKVLRIARETRAIPLMEAIAKLSYYQADFVDEMVPDMRLRGRLQPGMVADITVFNPDTVTDNSGYELGKNALPATGIPYVIVNGTVVVEDSKVLEGVYPGEPIRNEVLD